MPRPTRRRAFFAPGAGLRVFSSIALAFRADEVVDAVDHAAYRRRIFQFNRLVNLAQAQAAHGLAVLLLAPDDAFDQRHLDFLVRHAALLNPGSLRRFCRAWLQLPPACSSTSGR